MHASACFYYELCLPTELQLSTPEGLWKKSIGMKSSTHIFRVIMFLSRTGLSPQRLIQKNGRNHLPAIRKGEGESKCKWQWENRGKNGDSLTSSTQSYIENRWDEYHSITTQIWKLTATAKKSGFDRICMVVGRPHFTYKRIKEMQRKVRDGTCRRKTANQVQSKGRNLI